MTICKSANNMILTLATEKKTNPFLIKQILHSAQHTLTHTQPTRNASYLKSKRIYAIHKAQISSLSNSKDSLNFKPEELLLLPKHKPFKCRKISKL